MNRHEFILIDFHVMYNCNYILVLKEYINLYGKK